MLGLINDARYTPFQQQASSGDDHVAHIVADRAEGVGLDHASNGCEFFSRFGVVRLADERETLAKWHIRPVGAIRIVAVIWQQERAENRALAAAHVGVGDVSGCNVLAGHVGTVRRGEAIVAHRGVGHDGGCLAKRLGGGDGGRRQELAGQARGI